jgi:phage head maturation protease
MNNTVTVKALTADTAIVAGYGVIFGGADLEGDTFTKSTNYMLDLVPAKPVCYDHTMSAAVPHVIGTVKSVTADETGLWVEAELKRSEDYVDAVLELINRGVIGWSSGSVPHLVRREAKSITQWPVIEWSLTPTPAEPRTLGVERIKSVTGDEQNETTEAAATQAEESASPAVVTDTPTTEQDEPARPAGKTIMTLEEMAALLAAQSAEIKALQAAAPPINTAGFQVVAPAVITGETRKYDNIDTGDLALLIETTKSAKAVGRSSGPTADAYKALAMRLESAETGKSEPLSHAVKSFKSRGLKANELNYSTLANYGDEWVGVAYSGVLWEAIRQETRIVSMLPTIEVPQGAESVVIPLESTDPIWYKVAQATAMSSNPGGIPTNTVTASRLGTAAATMTLSKLGARVIWTGEMEEDSMVPFVSELRRQLTTSGAEYLEAAVIDGDTAAGATTNINYIVGTPGGSEYFMTVDGFRKLALVTNTANSRDGGTLASSDFLETVKLMGVGGVNADKNKTAFIINSAVHFKALELADVKSRDIFNPATIENGLLAAIYGFPIYVSHHMHKAATTRLALASGKVDGATPTNGTTGSILAVRWDQWRFGYKRRMTIESTRIPAADSTEIVALMRFGLINRDTEASAISYNLTV